ncbi:unnamed protein product [Effrenium voratum]|nr:unnamed protein product [Effrenium voratum]
MQTEEPPFWDSGVTRIEDPGTRACAVPEAQFQRSPAFLFEKRGPSLPGDEAAARVWWCGNDTSLLCASTAAHRDPFRSLMYSTNPMLFRRETWELHVMSYMTLLQDLRAVEETLTSSYTWRVEPTFVLGLSLGLFRHHRLDRRSAPHPDDPLAALCDLAQTVRPWLSRNEDVLASRRFGSG